MSKGRLKKFKFMLLQIVFIVLIYFFKLKKKIVKIHKVNTVLPHPVDASDQMMFALLDYGIEDISTMIQLCQKYQREHPTEMWLI